MTEGQGAPHARLAAAELYERELVPSAFRESAIHLADVAQIRSGDRVLDVGCGTGVVARECARRVGGAGSVVGLDMSEEMLTVARRTAPDIPFVRGDATAIPFDQASFDRVLCQFALMFFPDRTRSVAEMWRVTALGGRLAVSVSGRLEDSPVNMVLAELIRQHVGDAGYHAVGSIYALGDPADIEATFASAGIDDISVETEWGITRSPSLDAFVHTEIRSWAPLSELFDDDALASLIRDSRRELAFSVTYGGQVEFRSSSHTITATKVSAST
jgi:ubiquinone/menaquinone biosynthesis C-methylase UbiE